MKRTFNVRRKVPQLLRKHLKGRAPVPRPHRYVPWVEELERREVTNLFRLDAGLVGLPLVDSLSDVAVAGPMEESACACREEVDPWRTVVDNPSYAFFGPDSGNAAVSAVAPDRSEDVGPSN